MLFLYTCTRFIQCVAVHTLTVMEGIAFNITTEYWHHGDHTLHVPPVVRGSTSSHSNSLSSEDISMISKIIVSVICISSFLPLSVD